MSEVEFEIVEKPSAGKPGLMRIKQEKPALERLVEVCRKHVFVMGNSNCLLPDKFEVAAQNVVNGWGYPETKEMAKILLELEAEKTKVVVKEECKVYKSDVWFATGDTTRNQDVGAAKMSGKKYIAKRYNVFNIEGYWVCCTKDLIDDTAK